ncbi:MAG TPA: class I SAM-dependent rRNA methyltransferase [Terriglobales bacterium]|nr:class I SAM-dependent rRNA methyltransferase [Terriglobales bacterium]
MELRLKPAKERSVSGGHPWIFSGALAAAPPAAAGTVVRVLDSNGKFLAAGYYNPRCGIAVRVLTLDDEAIDGNFFRRRVAAALALRRKLLPPRTDAFRLINGEGDFLPGFVADVYRDVVVLQCLTAGAAMARSLMLEALVETLQPRGIFERSAGSVRREEGLGQEIGTVHGEVSPEAIVFEENGLQFEADIRGGQKTGFFLDQRDNRQLIRELAAGRVVLNAFAYTGAFSVYAAAGGAARVVSVESSANAIEVAVRHYQRNGISAELVQNVDADVFRFLRQDETDYDLLVLDPPALAKHRRDVQQATRAYKDLHLCALRRSAPGALIATFTCSQHVPLELLARTVNSAATDVHRRVQVLRHLGAGADHPTHIAHPEGEYLKGLLLRVD